MRYYMSVSMGVDVMAHKAQMAAACTHLPNHLVQLLLTPPPPAQPHPCYLTCSRDDARTWSSLMMTPGLYVFRLESRFCRSRLVWLASGSCPPVLARGEAAAC